MNETAKNQLEVAQDHGAALLDNTTLAGVEPALWHPETASFADVQSLACVLEAVVLHESLFADSWYNQELIPHAMVELTERAEGSSDTRYIFTMFDFVDQVSAAAWAGTEEGLPMFALALVKDALDRLERALRPGGGLDRQYELLVERLGAGQSFSAHYLGPRPLREEIIELSGRGLAYADEGGVLAERIRALEGRIGERLLGATEDLRLYAMFLLRAFYYEELAAAFSLSYVPHTFRAEALLALKRGERRTTHVDVSYVHQPGCCCRPRRARQAARLGRHGQRPADRLLDRARRQLAQRPAAAGTRGSGDRASEKLPPMGDGAGTNPARREQADRRQKGEGRADGDRLGAWR